LREGLGLRPTWVTTLWVAALVALEWHLVWAGLSGMETLALALLTVAVLFASERGKLPPLALGAMIGLGVWLRPDALLLALPAAIVIGVDGQRGTGERLRRLLWVAVGLCLLFVPYLAFNRSLSGEWWPSTFYAKQAEYASLRADPLWTRLLQQVRAPLAGAGAVLASACGERAAHAFKEGRFDGSHSIWGRSWALTPGFRSPTSTAAMRCRCCRSCSWWDPRAMVVPARRGRD
jgi:hypothetical protein